MLRCKDEAPPENARAQAREEELEALSGFIADGLERPVHAIESLAASLFEDHEDGFDELGREEARLIMLEVARLAKIVRDLSECSRICGATAELRLVSLDAIAEEVLRQWRPYIEANGASVTVQRPLGHALADASILTPVFSRLLENALKSLGAQATPKVSIWAAPAAGTNRMRLCWMIMAKALETKIKSMSSICFIARAALPAPGTGLDLQPLKRVWKNSAGPLGPGTRKTVGGVFGSSFLPQQSHDPLKPRSRRSSPREVFDKS